VGRAGPESVVFSGFCLHAAKLENDCDGQMAAR